ncbi:ABC transporter permease [Tersicoccus solisilvae]|uniref:ABC transporter permease n=1 Tax=Tersicoccus solisilvae TaxID=1882339 RepID=A0ABQ1NQT8_9MICC|nr:iron ABC transporter permease [Tersicoccus solisilvae]GGC80234.1 ABC transporter permease [Tersicoccus solisilvae]
MTTTESLRSRRVPAVRGTRRAVLSVRVLVLGTGSAVALVVLCFASLAIGSQPFDPGTVVAALTAPDPNDAADAIIGARVPRTVAGVLVGAALGLSGGVLQGVTRNPLGDAGLLGINAGAAVAVVLAIFTAGVGSLTGYVWFALAGAAVATLVIFALAGLGPGRATPLKLAITGATVNAGLASVISGVLVSSSESFDAYRQWQVGLIAGRDWEQVLVVAPFLAVGAVLALASGPALNGLALGDDVARGLGQRIGLTRTLVCVSVVLLAGGATALAGPVAFVGLVIPHAVRALTEPDYRTVLPLCALLAPVLLLGADIVGRVIAPPGEIAVGVMTAVIGAPVFIALVRRRKLGAL